MGHNFKQMKVKTITDEKLVEIKRYLKDTRGGKWSRDRVLNYLIKTSTGGGDVLGKIQQEFDEMRAKIHVILRINGFSSNIIELIEGELSLFQAIIAQQIIGSIDPMITSEQLGKIIGRVTQIMGESRAQAQEEFQNVMNVDARPEHV